MKLNSQYKKENFDNLNPFIDPKAFWQTCKPFVSNKHFSDESTSAQAEKDEMMIKGARLRKI